MASNTQANGEKPIIFDLYRLASKGALCTLMTGAWKIGKYQFMATKYNATTNQAEGVWTPWVSLTAMVHAARMIPFAIARGGKGKIQLVDYFGGSTDKKTGLLMGRHVEISRDNPEDKFAKMPWRIVLTEGEGSQDANGAIQIKPGAVKRQFAIRFTDQHAGELAAAVMLDAQCNARHWLGALYRKSQEKREGR